MENAPYCPVADVAFDTWLQNFSTILTAEPTDFGLASGDAVLVAAEAAAYSAALAVTQDPGTRTPVAIQAKNDAKAHARAVVLPYAVRISADPAVTSENKALIGVTVRITTRTRNPVIDVPCTVAVETMTPEVLTIRTQNPDTPDSTARPLGSRGSELAIRVRNALNTADETTVAQFTTRALTNLQLQAGWHGRVSYIRSRWVGAPLQGGATNLGQWSPEIQVLLP